MDDKLYYVEGPEGQVLGPMTMMNVLEGIAAGAVLEDARVCEVGQAGWTNLSDLACARDEAAPEPTPAPPVERARPVSSVRKLSDDFLVQDRWTAPPSATREEPEPLITQDEPGSYSMQEPAATPVEEPVYYEDTAEAASFETTRHETTPHETYADSDSREVEEWADATRELANEDRSEERAETFHEPHYGFEDTTHVVERPKSGDFSVHLADADDEQEAMARAHAGRRSSRRRLLPWTVTAVGIAAALGGLWFTVGSKLLGAKAGVLAPGSGTPDATLATNQVEDAWRAMSAGNAATALPEFRSAVEAQPENVRAQHGLGRAALLTGDFELASAHLERATSLSPDDAKIHIDLGNVRLREGRWQLAIQEAEKAQAIEPEAPEPLLLIGRAQAGAGRHDAAVKVFARYLELSPKSVDARKDLAQALAAAGRVAPAIDEINTYLAARSSDREAQEARLQWMISVGQQATAGRIYGEAAAKQKDDGFAQYLAGIACTGTEDGVTHLSRAVELTPAHRESWKRLAEAQAALGRNALAVDAMNRAVALAPANVTENKQIEAWRAATPPVPPPAVAPVVAGPVPTLADRAGEIRRSLGRGDFRASRRALEAARTELTGREAQRNLALWTAITDFEEGNLKEAQEGFAALNPDASYMGFAPGAVRNWNARALLALGDVRGAIGILDEVGPEQKDEYASARLWEGIALSSLGMDELAQRTWSRLSEDVGSDASKPARAAVKSAEFLAGSIAEKEYRTAVAPLDDYENDMHFFLGWSRRAADAEAARRHFREAMDTSHGREFPYHLAQGELEGAGLGRK